jgi:hypothetical protein
MLFALGVQEQKVGYFFLGLDLLHHDFRFGADVIANLCPFLLSIWNLWNECFQIGARGSFLLFLFLR